MPDRYYIRIAFAGVIDMGDIADKLALPRGALASARPALPPKCKH